MSGIGINFCKDRHKDGQRAQTAKIGGRWSVWEDLGVDQGVWRRGGTHWHQSSNPPEKVCHWNHLTRVLDPYNLPSSVAVPLSRSRTQPGKAAAASTETRQLLTHIKLRPPHLTRQPIVTTHDTPQGQDGPSQQPEHGRLVHGHLGVHRRPDRWVH